MGDPCENPAALTDPYQDPFSGRTETISLVAPEVKCGAGGLEGATRSDNGHIIMSMFFDDKGQTSKPQSAFADACQDRENGGHKSGMGLIFRKVAGASPLPGSPAALHDVSNKSLVVANDVDARYELNRSASHQKHDTTAISGMQGSAPGRKDNMIAKSGVNGSAVSQKGGQPWVCPCKQAGLASMYPR
jgi:hypothetical protein